MYRRLIVSLALSVCMVAAFALPRPSDVRDAVAGGNYAKAESMLNEVLKSKPSAKAHYDLGQVYVFEGKHSLALNEFRQAQVLDPSLKFASSATEFTNKLANEQTLVAPPPAPRVQAQVQQPVYRAQVSPNVSTLAEQHNDSSAGLIVLILFGLVLLGVVAYFVMSANEKKKAQAARDADIREKTGNLVDLAKRLDDAVLIAKTATYDDSMKKKIIARIVGLQEAIRGCIGDLKDGRLASAGRIEGFENSAKLLAAQAADGLPSEPVSESTEARTTTSAWADAPRPWPTAEAISSAANAGPTFPTAVSRPNPYYSSRPNPYYSPMPAPAPHYYQPPVIVNNSSSDLLTGVLIGEALSRPHDRIVEREVVVDRSPRFERDSYEDRTPAPAPYYPPAPTPSFDSNSRDDRNDYSDSSPTIDSSSSSGDSDSY